MERHELELTARRATYLRGLQLLPLAGFMLWTEVRGDLGVAITGWYDLIAVGILLAAALGIHRYYVHSYGRVSVPNGRFLVARLLLLLGFVGGAWLDLSRLGTSADGLDHIAHDHQYLHHINLMIVLASISVLLWYRICVELRQDHLTLWGALVAVALIPIWHRGTHANSDVLPGLVTLAIAVTGIADHLALRRTFRSADPVKIDG